MKTIRKLQAGIATVGIIVASGRATAQLAPQMPPAAGHQPAMGGHQSSYQGLPGAIMVRDDPRRLTSDEYPREATPGREGDRYVMTVEQWNLRYGNTPEAQQVYARLAGQNQSFCSITTSISERAARLILRFEALEQRFAGHSDRFAELRPRIQRLRRSAGVATWIRRLAGGAAIALTGGLAAPGVVAYEAQSIAHGRGNRVSRQLMLANVDLTLDNIELTRANIESNLLTLEMDLFWVDLVTPWCNRFHPSSTAGAGYYGNSLPAAPGAGYVPSAPTPSPYQIRYGPQRPGN